MYFLKTSSQATLMILGVCKKFKVKKKNLKKYKGQSSLKWFTQPLAFLLHGELKQLHGGIK